MSPARLVAVAFAVVLAVHAPRAQSTPAFSVADILGAPFPSALVAAPAGRRVAWAFDARGRRNVWVAEGPSFAGRQVTSYAEDDGQEIASLSWAAGGTAVVYVRGGAANRQGEAPNPAGDAGGAEQAVWVVPAAGGSPRKLGAGSNPVVSPAGDMVAFVQRGQIWLAGVSGAPAAAQAARTRGSAGALRWSPDGTRIAFASGRGDHGFIGVFDTRTKAVSYLDPSVDRDMAPTWSPDGGEVAFVRVPVNSHTRMFVAQREAEPWSIRVASADDGRSRELWRADRGRGSVFSGVTGPQLLWLESGHVVFPWEKTGWRLLYGVSAAGGPAALLTPGEFEVEEVASSADGRAVIYNSNQDDIDRRHLWRVAPGSAPRALTSGKGIEWNPAPLAGGEAVAFLGSDARRPAQPMLREGPGPARPLAPASMPSAFPQAALVEPQAVTISAADGMRIPAQLFLPPAHAPGERHPAAIFFHGGSRRQMLLGWHYGSYYHNAYALNQYLASRGFVVLAVNYRSGIGYGLDFREAVNYGADGASEFNDTIGAGLYLRARPDVDPARIALWGGSYGGYLTAHGLARASHLFAAGVDLHGVHDWNVAIRHFQPEYNALADPAFSRRAFESSPMAFIDGWRSPVLAIHGDDDRNVSFGETVALVEKLRERGVEVEQVVFPDEVHGFLLHRNWVRAYEATAEFLIRRLVPRAAGR